MKKKFMLKINRLANKNFLSSLDISSEELKHILELAKHFKNNDLGGNSFNFGPKQVDILTVEHVIKLFCSYWTTLPFD